MNPRINLTGHVYGRLTVVNRAGTNPSGNSMWYCKCECGNTRVVLYQHLRNGRTKSCGCIRAEKSSKVKVGEDWL